MANLSNAEKTRLLGISLTGVQVALLTADPTDAGTLTSEVVGGGYARQAATFNAPAAGATNPAVDVVFPKATASWGVVTHVALVSTEAGDVGAVRWHGPLNVPKAIDVDDTFTIPAADFDVSLN